MATKISVIIPTYAPKDYLWECLGSLENQTLSKDEFEVILVLNGEREPYESLIRKNYQNTPLPAHCFTQPLMVYQEQEIMEWKKPKVAISVSSMMMTGYQTTI